MLAIRLPPEIEQRLEALAQKTGRSKSFYVRAAIMEFLPDIERRHGMTVAEPRGAYRLARLRANEGSVLQLSAVLFPADEGGFVALNPETETTTQGESIGEALANLREATELYLSEFPLKHQGTALLTTFQVAAHGP